MQKSKNPNPGKWLKLMHTIFFVNGCQLECGYHGGANVGNESQHELVAFVTAT